MPTNAAQGTTRFISSRKISLRVFLWIGSKPKFDCIMTACPARSAEAARQAGFQDAPGTLRGHQPDSGGSRSPLSADRPQERLPEAALVAHTDVGVARAARLLRAGYSGRSISHCWGVSRRRGVGVLPAGSMSNASADFRLLSSNATSVCLSPVAARSCCIVIRPTDIAVSAFRYFNRPSSPLSGTQRVTRYVVIRGAVQIERFHDSKNALRLNPNR